MEDRGKEKIKESSCVILAGGKSRRMGSPKSELRIGSLSFLDKLVYELSSFPELLISVDRRESHPDIAYPMVEDLYPDCGPLGGLCSALRSCRFPLLFVLPCDVPLFSEELAACLLREMTEDADCVISETEDGRLHPFCAVYRSSCLPALEEAISRGELKMLRCLEKLRTKIFRAGRESWRYRNINTPADYASLSGRGRSVLAVSAYKNSGKTALIERLIPELSRRGIRVMTVKHDGHCYEPDIPGKDSYRFFQAGAEASLIFDSEKYSLSRRGELSAAELFRISEGVDLILLEGFKWTDYPKIEVLRRETGKGAIEGLSRRLAYVTDWEREELPLQGEKVFGMNEISTIADFIEAEYRSHHLEESELYL